MRSKSLDLSAQVNVGFAAHRPRAAGHQLTVATGGLLAFCLVGFAAEATYIEEVQAEARNDFSAPVMDLPKIHANRLYRLDIPVLAGPAPA